MEQPGHLLVEVGLDLLDPPPLGVDVQAGVLMGKPIPSMRRVKLMAPPVAIMVLEGMQSQRWAAPPTMSRSIRVTSAPRRARVGGRGVAAGPSADDDHPGAGRSPQRLGW